MSINPVCDDKKTGLFGKLPAHGDFIYRELPAQFINVWDEWLQGYVGGSQEQLGDAWLDTYMTSPIWRFAFSEGVIDENAWAGVFLPSVDRVGRYFPFSVASRLPAQTNPTDFLCSRPNWYQAMEEASLRALDGQIKIDELVEELNDSNPMRKSVYNRGELLINSSRAVVRMPNNEQSPSSVLPFVLDAYLTSSLSSYSIWSTAGSAHMDAGVFVSSGLPKFSGIAAMMDGRWDNWGWSEPFPMVKP